MKKKITLLNMISSLMLQVVTIVSGLIVPRIVLAYFGSEVNGLSSSIGQFLSYIALVEGGITGVIMASMYKPLVDGDNDKISSIIVTAKKFYQKIGFIFIGYTIVLSIVYPLLKHTSFSFWYVFVLTIILSVSLLIQYLFSLTYRTLLDADKKIYIVSFTQMAISVMNIVLALVAVHIYPQIHLLKMITAILFVLQPVVYGLYIKKNYKINWKASEDKSVIKNRWDGFAINLAAFIHGCTDIAVLTIFTDLKTVSIYSVYLLVVEGLKKLIDSILAGLNPTLGHAYAKGDNKDLHIKLDLYEYIDFMLVFFLFTVCALLITPFVMLYTNGINDANYSQPVFAVVLVIAEAMYLLKFPHLNLSYVANKFKEVTIPAYIEAGLNIIVSIILVIEFGMIGVAIGTLLAMTFRLIFHIYYTTKLVEDRRQWIFYKKVLIFVIATIIGVIICIVLLPITEITVLSWIVHAIIYSLILGSLYIIVSFMFFKKEMLYFKSYLLKK